MKHLSNRYARVMGYKGMDIYTLRVVTPSDGDGLGYRIDDILYGGMVFDGIGEVMEVTESSGSHSEEAEE